MYTSALLISSTGSVDYSSNMPPPRYIRGLERVSAHVDWEKIDGFTGSEKAVRAALGVGDGSWQQNNYSFTVAAEKSLTLQIAQLTISCRHFLPLL
jgi:hypothetical protein